MPDKLTSAPDPTAVRVALWRALHVQVDPPPHIFYDEIGLRLAAPKDSWKNRPDMHPQNNRRARASIVARARFVEDLVTEQMGRGIDQYVILGAGLDTYVQRKPEIASRLRVFEIDEPQMQSWKKSRLMESGFGISECLRFVPVDFESGEAWWDKLKSAGFDEKRPTIVASTGVSMYLTREANVDTLRHVAALAPGSILAMTFMLPLDLIEPEERPGRQMTEKFARAAGTPFVSFFTPPDLQGLAREAGFKEVTHISSGDLTERYFIGRADSLKPSSSEQFLVATN